MADHAPGLAGARRAQIAISLRLIRTGSSLQETGAASDRARGKEAATPPARRDKAPLEGRVVSSVLDFKNK
jgi:hypothetical protein